MRFANALCMLSGLGLLTAAPARSQAPPIRVTLLGTGRPDPVVDRFGPATLVQAGGQNLLFDAGRGASQRLWQIGIPLGQVHGIFITHLHSDHTVGLPDIWLTGWLPTPFGGRREPLAVWGPPGTQAMMQHLAEAYAWDIRVRRDGEHLPPEGIAVDAHDVSEGVVLDRDGVRVTTFLVDHGGLLSPSFGYRVDYGGHSVVISGDTRPSDNLIRHAANTDVLVHEVAAVRPGLLETSASAPVARRILGFHTSPEDVGRVFTDVAPKLAVLTHVVLLTTDPAFAPPGSADVLNRARAKYDGRIALGHDLMQIDIGDEIAIHDAAVARTRD